VKILTRSDLGRLIRREAMAVFLMVALLFNLAGSLWAHFALEGAFFQPGLLGSWLLIHALGFLAIAFRGLAFFLWGAGLLSLQLYFHVAFNKIGMPYVPLAPIFFVVSALVLSAYARQTLWQAGTMWLLGWASSVWWINKPADVQMAQFYPVFFAAGMNVVFFACFTVVARIFSGRLQRRVLQLGPTQSFDEKRIHASKLQIVGELTASLVHEINNPLNNINGFSHQIGQALEENGPDFRDVVADSNGRIKFNVDRIGDITRAVRGFVHDSSRLDKSKVSLRKVVEDSLLLVQHNLKQAGIEVVRDFPSDELSVHGNMIELSQLVVNLLTNARDACRQSERKKVSIGFALDKGQARLWVEDTGPGIPDSLRHEVFKAFFTTKGANDGTGLGLYICSIIAARNGARLDYELLKDKQGRVLGTRFHLSLEALTESSSGARSAA
jgi:signal transduction histidine kinase